MLDRFPFRRSLASALGRHLAGIASDPFYPEVVWGKVQAYASRRGTHYRALALVGTSQCARPHKVFWRSRRFTDFDAAEDELVRALEQAAARFPLAFELVAAAESGGEVVVQRRFGTRT